MTIRSRCQRGLCSFGSSRLVPPKSRDTAKNTRRSTSAAHFSYTNTLHSLLCHYLCCHSFCLDASQTHQTHVCRHTPVKRGWTVQSQPGERKASQHQATRTI